MWENKLQGNTWRREDTVTVSQAYPVSLVVSQSDDAGAWCQLSVQVDRDAYWAIALCLSAACSALVKDNDIIARLDGHGTHTRCSTDLGATPEKCMDLK